MKKYLALIAFLFFYNNASAAFVEGLEDVPLMDGLEQITNDTLSFGNEESRLVEASLKGNKKFNEVVTFYKKTLSQMGWIYQGKRENTFIFEREGEVLEITKEQKKPLIIRLVVKSKI